MLTFKEFMVLSEQPSVLFDKPVTITVNIGGKPQKFTVDMIDVRAEDWEAGQVRTDAGVVMQSAPKVLSSFSPFTLPLADGQYINKDAFGASIDAEPKTRVMGRQDWAGYAEFLLNDKVVKSPARMRSTDARNVG